MFKKLITSKTGSEILKTVDQFRKNIKLNKNELR